MDELNIATKQKLRADLLRLRSSLDPEKVAAASAAVCRHLLEWDLFIQSRTVLAYLAFRNEVSLQALIDQHPEKIWALPRTTREGLVIHTFDRAHLIRHAWGMMEPPSHAPRMRLEQIELVLVPGVGFDRSGGRIGFGGGYYDRLLCQLDAVRVGIAHTESLVAHVPREEHDCTVAWLAVPDGILNTDKSPR